MTPLEHDEQVAIFQWAEWNKGQYPELSMMFAIPNGGKLPYKTVERNGRKVHISPERTKLMLEGLKPGVPDICLPVARNGFHGLFVELKRVGGNVSDEQKDWIRRLQIYNFKAIVCYGADDAMNAIREYLGMKGGQP